MQVAVGRALRVLHAAEEGVLALLLLALVGISALDIILRTLFDSGISWASPLARVLVLWLGMLGAVLATRGNQHIAIDLLARLTSPALRRWIKSACALFAAVVCLVVAWHSLRFVIGTYEYADEAFAGLPAWPLQAILPTGFGLMAIRFLIHSAGYALVPAYAPQRKGAEL